MVKPKPLFWVVILAGVALSILAYRLAANIEQRVAEAQFAADASERAVLIRNKFNVVTSTLQDLASLYAVSNVVTGEQFERFVGPILDREPALQALSWNPVITDANRRQHEGSVRARGWPGYQIQERSADGTLVPAASRDYYVVVANIEPFEGNESALGFDVNSEPARRQALEKAREEGSLSIATPIRLVQAKAESTGALVFLPHYRSGMPLKTPDERRAAIDGFFVAVVEAPKLVAEALTGLEATRGHLTISTLSAGGGASTLFDSNLSSEGPAADVSESMFGGRAQPRFETVFPWGAHEVLLTIEPDERVFANARSWVPAGLMLAVLMVAGFGAVIARFYGNRAVRIAGEVDSRTLELRVANDELREEIARRQQAEERLASAHSDLEKEVEKRTAQLYSTSNQLRSILESEPECVKIVSADGRLEDMNSAGLSMIEADSLEEVRGCDVYALIADEHRDSFVELNKRVIAGERCTLEFEIVGMKGRRRWVETHAAPLEDPEEGKTRHLAITRDITARKKAEEERARLEAQLRHSQKLESVGVLAGGIAHDFNNLLQVIIGNAEIALQAEDLSTVGRETLEANRDAAMHAARLCDQMLTYAGRTRSKVEPIHLSRVAGAMVDLLKMTHSKDTVFKLQMDENDDLIRGDETQLSQVLLNLITNAAESIRDKPGEIEVLIHTVEVGRTTPDEHWLGVSPEPGRYVALEVADNGCGMDEATIERMFDPYFTTKFAGRGLGLSATLGIIQSHNGYVGVSSRPGEGSRITALFPVVADGKDEQQTQGLQREQIPAAPLLGRKATVLVVDDDQSVLNIGDAMLRHLGCQTVLASDGAEAVERFRHNLQSIDAVLLDVTMPRLNGNEACAVMRSLRPDIPVVFCSGYSDDAVGPQRDATAFTGFLHKPYRKDDLERILIEALAA